MSTGLTKVALIGLGRMGTAMAERIAGAGYPLVLWNRDRSKAEKPTSSLGSEIASTPSDAAANADVVLTSLADDRAVLDVYLGENGIVHGLSSGTICVDTSTVSPKTVLEVGAAVDGTGAQFLDCPVSGSVSTVEAGALIVMAGGDEPAIETVRPILDTMAARVIRVGDRGSGAACKLAVNGLVHGLNIALSEAVVLAERAGVARDVAYEVFANGAGGAPFVQYKRAAYLHPETTAVAFSLDLVAKDLELITQLGREVDTPMRQADVGLEIVRDAVERGMGERDLSAIAVFLRGGA